MPTKVIMPQLGESVEEGTISKWLKSIGDPVEEYEALLEVNTDKVDTEIPSPASGILLAIQADEGEIVKVGRILAWIGQLGEDLPGDDLEPDTETLETVQELITMPGEPDKTHQIFAEDMRTMILPGRHPEFGYISPIVAKLANEYRVDLALLSGSGEEGRITKADLLKYIDSAAQKSATGELTSKAIPSIPTPQPTSPVGEILPLTPVRRAIADHMVISKHTSPHVTTVMEADLSRIIAHRNANKENFKHEGIKLTFTPYFISATSTALLKYPIVNSSWSEDGIILHPDINIGMATSLDEEGLIVPVIRNADHLSLSGLARSVNDLANRARTKQLRPDEVRDGTFTITNHGISGSLFASPVINQPQCAILGVGAIQKRVIVISDEVLGDTIAIRPMVYLTLTFDHRILDGAIADYFLQVIVDNLQNWC